MKKINRRGFTLIELLAVIVVLGLVMVVTIPSVINAVKASRQEAYDDAIAIIEKYVNDERVKCLIELGNPGDIDEDTYNSTIFDDKCNLVNDDNISYSILKATYFMNDIESLVLGDTDEDGVYEVLNAPITSDSKFNGVTTRKALTIDPGAGEIGGGGGIITDPTKPKPKF